MGRVSKELKSGKTKNKWGLIVTDGQKDEETERQNDK